jgi:hypothetical protein
LNRPYRPLVYYAAFGDADIVACLRHSIGSLLMFGGWSHEILVLTRESDLAAVQRVLADFRLGPRLHFAVVPGADLLDWCLARYRLDASPPLLAANPVLYLDTDVFCDRSLRELMEALARVPGIHVRSEGRLDEGGLQSGGHWFGWRLLAADGIRFDPTAPGFSSGVIGFADATAARDSFEAILRSAYDHAERTGNRHHYAGYDQPFANYVLRKFRRFDTRLLDRVVRLHRVAPDRISFPDPARAAGLVHFTGGVGMAAPKREAMARYSAAILGRSAG